MLDSTDGKKVAESIDRRITTVAEQVYNNSPYTKIRDGIVTAINGKTYTVKIHKAIYNNIYTLKGTQQINVNDRVICIIPNNQYSNMFILGVLDI